VQSKRAATLMTAEGLLHMPDDGWSYELDRGELIRMSPAGSRAGIVTFRVSLRFGSFVEQHQLGVCGSAEWGFRLSSNPDTVRAPDVGFVRAERISVGGIPEGYWSGAPDLAIEVLSPTDRFADLLVKVQEYLTAGTRLVWVIDPEARKAFIFRPSQAPEIVDADGELSGEDVVPGFVLHLTEVWV
jgi:Uma2 family endonuclease